MKSIINNYVNERKQDIFNNTDKRGMYHGGMEPIVEDVIGLCFCFVSLTFIINSLVHQGNIFISLIMAIICITTIRYIPKIIVDSYLEKALKQQRKESK